MDDLMFRRFRSHLPLENRKTYAESVIGLVGHLFGTGVIFVSFFLVGWAVSFFLHFLNGIHPFPAEILDFITKFELYLVYGDSVLCAFVLLGGAFRFIAEGWRNRK
ncbi:hypothetical protein GTP81_00335 [Rugamonas sp. FT107W]|uniref:Uncharacterized protein n=1 Tax=Duganella vulcania TaxID=2692166 RepID=A0A845H8V9_9BURK|nr:hypothetical protein [Duganella vulcania]MYN15191.1 hypothetical protein [Duganella vulcania]